MKRFLYFINIKIIYFIILITLNWFVFTEEYHIYKQELIKIIPVGTKKNEIKNDIKSPAEMGPSGFGFDSEGLLYICDILNDKLVIFDEYFNYKKSIYNIYAAKARQIEIKSGKYYLKYSYDFAFAGDTFDGKKKFLINLRDSKYRNRICFSPNFFYYADIVFIYLRDGSLISIPNPGLDYKKNNEKILSTQGTKELIISYFEYDLKGLTIDNENRLFLNNELLTRDYLVFYKYWKEYHNKNEIEQRQKKDLYGPEYFLQSGFLVTYLGKDANKNVYWDANGAIVIFNNVGWLIDAFICKNLKSKTLPAVHPSGDVYFLDYDGVKNYLYRVKNVWDPEGRAKWYSNSGVKDLRPISQTPGK